MVLLYHSTILHCISNWNFKFFNAMHYIFILNLLIWAFCQGLHHIPFHIALHFKLKIFNALHFHTRPVQLSWVHKVHNTLHYKYSVRGCTTSHYPIALHFKLKISMQCNTFSYSICSVEVKVHCIALQAFCQGLHHIKLS